MCVVTCKYSSLRSFSYLHLHISRSQYRRCVTGTAAGISDDTNRRYDVLLAAITALTGIGVVIAIIVAILVILLLKQRG